MRFNFFQELRKAKTGKNNWRMFPEKTTFHFYYDSPSFSTVGAVLKKDLLNKWFHVARRLLIACSKRSEWCTLFQAPR